ncbi:lysosomal alpha-glucosidase [Microcaecilia unicolor]|uniref:Lysosomal alpha-glucosidase-like n=1 Tax=Microcaecilia unicolor TaxID=1415580 RepID=A0A6P7YQA3_9AMPH|nr:lysosomal alpha-glucosidase-like [Microcaecilia unicolor]
MFTYQKLEAPSFESELCPEKKGDICQKSIRVRKSSLLTWTLAIIILGVVFVLIEVILWALKISHGLDSRDETFRQTEINLSGQTHEQNPLDKCSSVLDDRRFDCYPERDVVVTRELCENRGCCFLEVSRGRGIPWCFYPPDFPSYTLEEVNQTSLGLRGLLRRKVKAYYVRDIERLQLSVNFETNTRLHIKLTDASSPRYEVPFDVPQVTKKAEKPIYGVDLVEEPFGVVVRRIDSGAILLNTTVAPLIFADQFLQISTTLPSKFLYGLGEHRSSFLHSLDWKTLTFWACDVPPVENCNLYGAHPFYLMLEDGGSAHGVFLLNSNAMEVAVQPAPALTWRTIGGILDFYIFLGPSPAAVIQQYQEVIGFPTMPPFWGLGFHLCRWGYGTSNDTWQVVKDMRREEIPQDAQWNDIDYMVGYRDFTFDPERFDTLPQMVDDLHRHGQHYIPILDPGISSTQPPGSYWPYDEGLIRGIFINTSQDKLLIGEVWPGHTVYPDFTNPETHQWWFENLNRFYNQVPFDGLWIDMNEPSNFKDGSLDGCSSGDFDNPPYVPAVLGESLFTKTVCASAKQNISVHYNVHNLYGLMEAKATASALIKLRKKRPFVISRSTFPSQGRYSGHWLGDNRSQWKDMYWSIPGMLNFNLFGIPLIGADICGFSGPTTEELCTRWMQLGAFYPFARNHNMEKEKAQDPTVFSPKVRAAMKDVLLTRYSLLPFLYTLFHRAHLFGETVVRPLFFEFPEDVETYSVDRQFLWGRSLLVTPVLDAGIDSVTGYFPEGMWYDYYTGSELPSSGENLTLAAPLDQINVHIRAGAVIPTQRPGTTSWVSSGNPLRLIAALSQQGEAWGDLFWDDGESVDTFEREDYSYLIFNVSENTFSSRVVHANKEATCITVETLSVLGVKSKPSKVTVDGKEAPFFYLENQVLMVEHLNLNLSVAFSIYWK